jgi:hypothetical protein
LAKLFGLYIKAASFRLRPTSLLPEACSLKPQHNNLKINLPDLPTLEYFLIFAPDYGFL